MLAQRLWNISGVQCLQWTGSDCHSIAKSSFFLFMVFCKATWFSNAHISFPRPHLYTYLHREKLLQILLAIKKSRSPQAGEEKATLWAKSNQVDLMLYLPHVGSKKLNYFEFTCFVSGANPNVFVGISEVGVYISLMNTSFVIFLEWRWFLSKGGNVHCWSFCFSGAETPT